MKVNITKVRAEAAVHFDISGSVLAGTIKAGAPKVVTRYEIESPEDPAKVAAMLRTEADRREIDDRDAKFPHAIDERIASITLAALAMHEHERDFGIQRTVVDGGERAFEHAA